MNDIYILGIHAGHDASVSLLKNGELIFASEEERYSKIKHHNGFPYEAIAHALAYANITFDEVDYFAFSPYHTLDIKNLFYYISEASKMFKNLVKVYGFKEAKAVLKERMQYHKIQKDKQKYQYNFDKNKSFSVDHHLAHVASSYFCSGFDRCGFISWDYAGASISTTLGYANNGEIFTKYKIGFPHSLGYLYAYITKYLGFNPWGGEGKVMGLAPYGKNVYDFGKIISLEGYTHKINPKYLNLIDFEKSFYDVDYIKFSPKIENFLGPHLKKFEFCERSADIACSLQTKIEEIGLDMVKKLTKEFEIRNLCISGGLGLNCKLNGLILASGLADNIFVQPSASDAGLSLGAALYLHKKLYGKMNYKMEHVYYGDGFDNNEIEDALSERAFIYEKYNDITKVVAELLAEGNVVGWFQGRMEFGPRALGNRSILADPRDEKIKDIVNKFKGRELWRPLTPSFLIEEAENYLENYKPSPFMTITFKVKEDKIKEIPAVVHVDGTARIQTVDKKTNPKYWKLINNLKKETGSPCVLNTSMNIAGMPIACTPDDALFTMEKMGLDYMAIGDYLFQKER